MSAVRSRWVPEVVQSSVMDCGPAALKCLCEGFGIQVGYGRLREACQTSVDGTSIDALEAVSRQLGLDAEQVMLPGDHLFLREAKAWPALLVVQQREGNTHFVVVWRQYGSWLQVMDPAVGRRWMTRRQLARSLHAHTVPVDAEAYRSWACSPESVEVLRARLVRTGIAAADSERMLVQLGATADALAHAQFDAAVRMVTALLEAGALRRGRETATTLQALIGGAASAIPDSFWSARPHPQSDNNELWLRGAVLLRVRGRIAAAASEEMAAELRVALSEPRPAPYRTMARLVLEGTRAAPALVGGALALLAAGIVIEAMLLRALAGIGGSLLLSSQKLVLLAAIAIFAAVLLALDWFTAQGAWRFGRRLELRFRAALLHKIPRLHDHYFQSRLSSDMAERSHNTHVLRDLLMLVVQGLRTCQVMVLTAIAIVWVDPASAPWVVAMLLATIVLPLAMQPLLVEYELRERTHAGGLMRFYLDALLGLAAIRAHSAERTFARQYESHLTQWGRAALAFGRIAVSAEAASSLCGLVLAAALLHAHISRSGELSAVLLLAYWALQLPQLGQTLVATVRQFAAHHNIALRLLEPLTAPEESALAADAAATDLATAGSGWSVSFDAVDVQVAGHTVLQQCSLRVAPGEHIAIVGVSGAGKSTLMGLLLGWYRPAAGEISVGGQLLTAQVLANVRQHIAWVDPAVQLWNDSVLANVRYGLPATQDTDWPELLDKVALADVLARLPEGLQTLLGEGGAALSGGEGQRLRVARALARQDARLAILDEPFRGLDRQQRHKLLGAVREHWREQTLFCITHDVAETLEFPRVVVIEQGRIIEDGAPQTLRTRAGSRYRALLDAEQHARQHVWQNEVWRRFNLSVGQLREEPTARPAKVVGLERGQ